MSPNASANDTNAGACGLSQARVTPATVCGSILTLVAGSSRPPGLLTGQLAIYGGCHHLSPGGWQRQRWSHSWGQRRSTLRSVPEHVGG